MKLKQMDNLVSNLFKQKWRGLPSSATEISSLFEPGIPGIYIIAYPEPGNDLSGKVAKPRDDKF